MNASNSTLAALQSAVASPRMYSCTKLDEQLAHTHRRLLTRLGSGRDTLVWQARIDAPAATVWQAAAGSVQTFFSHLSDVEAVRMLDEGPAQEGSRYALRRNGFNGERVGEVLVSVPGSMLTASDVDPDDASGAGLLPALHCIVVRNDPDHPGRSILELMGVTLGCYNMWMLATLKEQAASISARVEGMLRKGGARIYRLDNESSLKDNAIDNTEKTMETNRTGNTAGRARRGGLAWIFRLAVLAAALMCAAAAQAQQNFRPDISAVHQLLYLRGPYQFDHRYERIWLADVQTGRTLMTLTVDASDRVVLRGVIGRTARMDPQTKQEVMSTISLYNFRSNAGQMSYDEASGELRLTRVLPAGTLTALETAEQAVKFTDILQEEATKFAEAQAAGVPYCALMCSREE